MANEPVLRIVLASPSDVQPEREVVGHVVEFLDHVLRDDVEKPVRLELHRWETDAYPGLHPGGPQAIVDERLRIGDSHILIGVFWKRFGTPTGDAGSGTEHEIRQAVEAWKAKGSPQVMLYFKDARTSRLLLRKINRVGKYGSSSRSCNRRITRSFGITRI